ncbi:hypothetical protein HHK36_016892 [Tetracentron sinense]|uniref:Plastocyanin-like domain-containing protein n=1 Tax=Tetracentron sinense TaxID=13715 RepID=A0A835DCC1_TETSI|nr:hypothetical protein HHK36_016892 [Tetracentron sinense]
MTGTRLYRLPYNSTVQVVLQNTGIIALKNHPIYLHGFNFFVVGRGLGNFNSKKDTKKFNLVDPVERNTIGEPCLVLALPFGSAYFMGAQDVLYLSQLVKIFITANWDFAFSVRNPNKKMAIFYDRVQSSVFYRDQFLSQTSLPPFHLGKKNQTTVRARFVALSAYVGDRVVMDIAGDRAAGVVNFNVKMLAWVRFKTGAWRTRIRLMRVFCNGVRVGFSSSTGPGTMLGGSGECEVDL